MRYPVAAALLAVAGAVATPALAGPGDAAAEFAARARRALEEDAADLVRVAEWADRNGLERTAMTEWERVVVLSPDDERARKRLLYVKRGKAWMRDDASRALLAPTEDGRPARRAEYATKRRQDFERPSSARHRALAARAFAAGLAEAGAAQLRLAIEHDPDDAMSRLAAGDVPDPADGWVSGAVRARRVAEAHADAEVRRLKALGSSPVATAEPATREKAAGVPLSVWRLREWRLETDLPPEAAADAIAGADLAGRWFRSTFGIEPGEPVLPGDGTFVVLSTEERYVRVVQSLPGLSAGVRTFAAGLSAFPLDHAIDEGPWEVVIQRPDGATATDACLHYAVHFLAQARFRVEAQEAWLYEGLAAYAAHRLQGFHGSWCVRLEDTAARAGGITVPDDPTEWPPLVEAMVYLRDDFPLRGLVGVSINGLDGAMLAKSWSVLRWLLEQHRSEARALFEGRREGLSTSAALRRATGLTLEDFDEAWRREITDVGPE